MAEKKYRDKKQTARYNRKYNSKNVNTGTPHHHFIRVGYICELLVAADMNARCGRAYPNPEPQTKDDVYAKTSLGWRTVQVKKVKTNRATSAMYLPGRKAKVTSDIVALVDLEGMRVKYKPWGKRRLPAELPTAPSPICSKLVFFAPPKEAAGACL